MALTIEALDHLVINVRDVDAAAAWYQRVLGMTREDFDPGPGKVRRTSMKFGRQKINLRPLSVSKDHLRACGVQIIEGPSDKRGAMGTIVSVYCRDPDGSLIEISSYK